MTEEKDNICITLDGEPDEYETDILKRALDYAIENGIDQDATSGDQENEVVSLEPIKDFVDNNPEYIKFSRDTIYQKPAELLAFFKAIKAEDFTAAAVPVDSGKYKDRYKELQERIKAAEEHTSEEDLKSPDMLPLEKIWPILRIRDIFTESELAAFYYLQNPPKRRRGSYITTAKRGSKKTNEIPDRLAIITAKGYQQALSMKAIYKPEDGVEIDDKSGRIKWNGPEEGRAIVPEFDDHGNILLKAWKGTAAEITAKLINIKNLNEVVNSISWHDLDILFTTISQSIQRQFENRPDIEVTSDVIVDAYELAEKLGVSRSKGTEAIKRAQKAVYQFVGLVGVIQEDKKAGVPDEYALIVYKGTEDNIISFSSPFIVELLQRLRSATVRKTRDGKIKTDKDGQPLFKASESYLIHSDIVKERDKLAVENVKIIVAVIEGAGKRTPHIAAREIIKRNDALNWKLQSVESNQRPKILKRVFANTWKYLKNDTDLLTKYINIQLPDENDIPSMTTLDTIYSFPSKGKPRKESAE